jgi:hypothetical protein
VIVALVGRLFRALARLRLTEGSEDLDHVGAELLRLGRPPAHRPESSR